MSRIYFRNLGVWKRKDRPDIGVAVPYRPTNPSAASITTTTFTLNWQAAQSPDPGRPVTNYKIYRDGVLVATIGNVLTSSQTGLTSGAIYVYEIAAVNSAGEGLKSYPLNVAMSGSIPGGGTPGAPTITDGYMISESSARIDWSAPTTGGTPTGYRVFRGGTTQIGSDLAANVFTLTASNLPVTTPSTTFNFTVRAFNASGVGPASTILPLTWQATETPDPLFAGHRPFTTIWGMAAPDGGSSSAFRPLWNDNPSGPANSFGNAIDIVGAENVGVHRYFIGSWINQNELNGWLNDADSKGIIMWGSFKAGGGTSGTPSWSSIAAGSQDASLNIIRDIAKARRAAGKRPFWMAIDHEPFGNGGGGPSSTEPERWVAMNLYVSDYFAGTKNGVYNAANDVRDALVWTSISNGQWWKPNLVGGPGSDADRWHPQSLINKHKQNSGILATDQYDAMPGGGAGGSTYSRTTNERIEGKVQKYIDWHRAKNCGAIGWGEIGATTSTAGGGSQTIGSLTQCWRTIRQNRDICVVVNYFNSGANSRWDWRLIPSNYPVTGANNVHLEDYWPGTQHTYVNSQGQTVTAYGEIGGTAVTGARLAEYIAIAQESQNPPWNTPPQ